MNLATWVDEVAYRHFEHAQTLENSPEYERAMLRANRLKGYAECLESVIIPIGNDWNTKKRLIKCDRPNRPKLSDRTRCIYHK